MATKTSTKTKKAAKKRKPKPDGYVIVHTDYFYYDRGDKPGKVYPTREEAVRAAFETWTTTDLESLLTDMDMKVVPVLLPKEGK